MKRIGLIDNLSHINSFVEKSFHSASAVEVMVATGGNTGNVAFVFGARKILKDPLTRVGWVWDPARVREQFDHLVICCANQVGAHADLSDWADRIQEFGLPVTLLGLGAQSDSFDAAPTIPEGTRRFLKLAQELRSQKDYCNIAVRGEYTGKVLESIGVESLPIGCPSVLISEDQSLGKSVLEYQATNGDIKKVAVAAGNPWHKSSAEIELMLTRIVNNYGGDYIIQHPVEMVKFAFGERSELDDKSIDRFKELYGMGIDSLFNWFRRNSRIFVDAPNWIRHMSHFDLVLGPRYHGVALGIQAGIPGCVITIDSRTKELCEGTCIKNISIEEVKSMSPDEMVANSLWTPVDSERFDAGRKLRAQWYVDFLLHNELVPSDHLERLASS